MTIETSDVRNLRDFVRAVCSRPLETIINLETVRAELEREYPDIYARLIESFHLLRLSDLLPVALNTFAVPVDRREWFKAFLEILHVRSCADWEARGLSLRIRQ